MGIETVNARIKKVKQDYEAKLLSIPGVVGVGTGEITEGLEGRQPCIRIYVEKRDEETLSRLPKVIGGFPTDIIEVGKPRLL